MPADLVSTVSVRLREGYSVREVTLAKGKGHEALPYPTGLSDFACGHTQRNKAEDTHASVTVKDSPCHLKQAGSELPSGLSFLSI